MVGPANTAPRSFKFSDAPYAPFSKGDKLGKVADWAAELAPKAPRASYNRGFRDPYFAYGASSSSFFTTDTPETGLNFSVVDSTKQPLKQPKQASTVLRRRGVMGGSVQHSQPQSSLPTASSAPAAKNPLRRQPWQQERKHREPSITIGADWKLVQTNHFSQFAKLHYTVGRPETLVKAGSVHTFDKKTENGLALLKEARSPYNVSTSDDPIMEKLISSKAGQVYATDKIIALLMCAGRTNLPWEVLITKKDGNLVFDKRDGGPLELLTVDENSSNPPQDTAEVKINTPDELAIEATYVNDRFSSSVLLEEATSLGEPNPYGDDGDLKGYVYNKINIESDEAEEPLNLVVRSEIDALSDSHPTLVRALNEYRAPLEWKNIWRGRRGAIFGSELRNNLAKISQWTVQAYLADARLKLGFVSRTNAMDRKNHELVGIVSREPAALAGDLGLNFDNGWGIVRSIVNIVLASEDGKYVLLRDPNAPALKIYRM